jgi:glycosyltransferase involved in cell wall biosynthesis
MTDNILKPSFSVIIPTLDEEVYLPLLLKDLFLQSFTDFEVIHVDGGSSDKTLQKAKQWQNKLNLKTIVHNVKSVSAQRNRGASEANGNWIIFMDADDRLPKKFLAGIKQRIDQTENDPGKRFDVFTTLVNLTKNDRKELKNRITADSINFFLRLSYKTNKPLILGSMIGIRKEVFQKVKFDEKNKVSEDNIFARECVKSGWKYKVLTNPTYSYSMRRVQSKGLMKTATTGLVMNLRYLIGDNFSDSDYGYEMLGGSAYMNGKNRPNKSKNTGEGKG